MFIDPITGAMIGGSALAGYYVLRELVSRPGSNSYGTVGERPRVEKSHQYGETLVFMGGTFGIKQGKRVAAGYLRGNCQGQICGYYAVELNKEIRDNILRRFPHPRLVKCHSPFVTGGFENMTMHEVGQPKMRAKWGT